MPTIMKVEYIARKKEIKPAAREMRMRQASFPRKSLCQPRCSVKEVTFCLLDVAIHFFSSTESRTTTGFHSGFGHRCVPARTVSECRELPSWSRCDAGG